VRLIPDVFSLDQNYPNPFNPSTTIGYGLPNDAKATLEIFSVTGQRVAVVVDENQPAGYYHVKFNTPGIASGVYFYRLRAEYMTDGKVQHYISTKKLVMIK
jgi:hypothetical protein